MLVVGRLIYGPIDRNPMIIDYKGNELILKNSAGSVIERISVGEVTVEDQTMSRSQERSPMSLLIDLNNDGVNELIYSNKVTRLLPEDSFVKAYSVSGDSTIWEKSVDADYSYPRQSGISNFNLRTTEVGSIRTPDGLKIIMNTSVIQLFQTVIFTLDSQTGEVEDEYVHPGRFDDMHTLDINNDGINEILLVGVNNAYSSAAISVLEYGNLSGYAPATIDYIPANTEPAKEYRYILIPKSIVGQYYSSMQKYNRGKGINLDESNRKLFFLIEEGTRQLSGYSRGIILIYYFDFNFKPIGIATSDLYQIVARDLYLEDKIPVEPGFEYFDAFKDSIQYWNGEEFVLTREFFKDNE